jgi:hypothetical protein
MPAEVRVYVRAEKPGEGAGSAGERAAGRVLVVSTKNVRRVIVDDVGLFAGKRLMGDTGVVIMYLDGTLVGPVEGNKKSDVRGSVGSVGASGGGGGRETRSFEKVQGAEHRGHVAFYCREARGSAQVVKGVSVWQPCFGRGGRGGAEGVHGGGGQAGDSSAAGDQHDACGCCSTGERGSLAGAGPIRRVFSQPFVMVLGTGSAMLLDAYLAFAQVGMR